MIENYQQLSPNEPSLRDQMIEVAMDEFENTGECLYGIITRDEILREDFDFRSFALMESVLDGTFNNEIVKDIKNEWNSVVSERINKAVDELIYENTLTKAGL